MNRRLRATVGQTAPVFKRYRIRESVFVLSPDGTKLIHEVIALPVFIWSKSQHPSLLNLDCLNTEFEPCSLLFVLTINQPTAKQAPKPMNLMGTLFMVSDMSLVTQPSLLYKLFCFLRNSSQYIVLSPRSRCR